MVQMLFKGVMYKYGRRFKVFYRGTVPFRDLHKYKLGNPDMVNEFRSDRFGYWSSGDEHNKLWQYKTYRLLEFYEF